MRKPITNPLHMPTHPSSSPHFTPKTLKFPPPKASKPLSFHFLCSSQSRSRPLKKTPTMISILRAIPDWLDDVKERGMQQKRSLYNHQKWLEHRSSHRHIQHLLSNHSSRVILSLVPPVIIFTTFSAIIAAYNSAVLAHWLPEFFPLLHASSLPYQLTASALALLLVFRTEASYSRLEEGRKSWMKVISGTSEFASQVIAGVGSSCDVGLKKALLEYIMAFPVALKCHVIYDSDIKRDLQNLLNEDDLSVVLSSKHRPRCIIEFISQSIRLLHLDETKRQMLESKISCFHEGIGVCDQLMGIPVPLSYTRLTSRFLVLWHFTLPIILWDDCNWIVVPATFVSAASLFCIEEVGVLIEEPFPMLPLDELCNLVHGIIQEAIAMENLVQGQLLSKQIDSNDFSPNGRPNS